MTLTFFLEATTTLLRRAEKAEAEVQRLRQGWADFADQTQPMNTALQQLARQRANGE